MPIKIIGKSVLGELGLSQNVRVMGDTFESQLKKAVSFLSPQKEVIMTSLTGSRERQATGNEYYPKILEWRPDIRNMFNPNIIYQHCLEGKDQYRPGCDFVLFIPQCNQVAITFSREAPIIAFESSIGRKALGTILRPSLMKYGDDLFAIMQEDLCSYTGDAQIKATLVTADHYNYPEGSIPSIIEKLAFKYDMDCEIMVDSEKDPECYHRGEVGNHVVALW